MTDSVFTLEAWPAARDLFYLLSLIVTMTTMQTEREANITELSDLLDFSSVSVGYGKSIIIWHDLFAMMVPLQR